MLNHLLAYKKRIILGCLLGSFCWLGAKVLINGHHALQKNARQYDLNMKLGYTLRMSTRDQVEALLKEGAGPNEADVGDALLLACGDEVMMRLLLKYGADPNISLRKAENVDQARAMLELGADVNARIGSAGDTPLTEYATSGHVEVVQFLIQRGADPTLRSQQGQAILKMVDFAARNHPESTAKYQAIARMLKDAIARQSPAQTHPE